MAIVQIARFTCSGTVSMDGKQVPIKVTIDPPLYNFLSKVNQALGGAVATDFGDFQLSLVQGISPGNTQPGGLVALDANLSTDILNIGSSEITALTSPGINDESRFVNSLDQDKKMHFDLGQISQGTDIKVSMPNSNIDKHLINYLDQQDGAHYGAAVSPTWTLDNNRRTTSEGILYGTYNYSPTSGVNTVLIIANLQISASAVGQGWWGLVFGSETTARYTSVFYCPAANALVSVSPIFCFAPANFGSVSIYVAVNGGGTVYINGYNGSALNGGSLQTGIQIIELS